MRDRIEQRSEEFWGNVQFWADTHAPQIDPDTPEVSNIRAYEEKLSTISRDQARLRENMQDQAVPAGSFEEKL